MAKIYVRFKIYKANDCLTVTTLHLYHCVFFSYLIHLLFTHTYYTLTIFDNLSKIFSLRIYNATFRHENRKRRTFFVRLIKPVTDLRKPDDDSRSGVSIARFYGRLIALAARNSAQVHRDGFTRRSRFICRGRSRSTGPSPRKNGGKRRRTVDFINIH